MKALGFTAVLYLALKVEASRDICRIKKREIAPNVRFPIQRVELP
jgi:cathepsin X